jgi:hypothetical protein
MEEEKTIRWKANEYIYHEKSIDWYWYFGLIAVILIISAIWLHNTLFAFIIAIGSFTMLIYANKHPRELEYTVDKNGISFDDVSYQYRDILFFYIVNDRKQTEEAVLLLQLKKTVSPIISIPLGNTKLDELQTFLLNFIKEKELPIPFGNILMNIIGF